MRTATAMIVAGALLASPATAQQTTGENTTGADNVAANSADPGLAGNVVDPTVNGAAPLPGDPAATAAVPPAVEDPALTDAEVTPETGEGRGFPWGLLGLLGLVGLLGRKRSD